MASVDLETLLRESGAVMRGHFILTSGRHSDVYVEKFRILEQPQVLSALCAEIADHVRHLDVELVAGPTTGGIIIAFETARQIGCTAIYVESEGGTKKIRRGATVPPGARVLIVDDVLTTGTSIREVIDVIRSAGGEVVAVAVLIDRSEGDLGFGVPLFAAHRVVATSYDPDNLPEELRLIPAIKPGTRVSTPGAATT